MAQKNPFRKKINTFKDYNPILKIFVASICYLLLVTPEMLWYLVLDA